MMSEKPSTEENFINSEKPNIENNENPYITRSDIQIK